MQVRTLTSLALALVLAFAAQAQPPRLVSDLTPFPAVRGSSPRSFARLGNQILFHARHDAVGYELWRTDGTSAGTVSLKDIHPGIGSTDVSHNNPPTAEFAGSLFFAATDGRHGTELWKTDGTREGTAMVADLGLDMADGEPSAFAPFGGSLFFLHRGAQQQLWKTDGTEAGTSLVATAGTHLDSDLVVAGSKMFFFSRRTPTDAFIDLWVSDGTTAGTQMIASFFGCYWYGYRNFKASGNRIFFKACSQNGCGACGLWTSDGTPAGTYVVPGGPTEFDRSHWDMKPLNDSGTVVFLASRIVTPGLWRSDGSQAGTFALIETPVGKIVRNGAHIYFTSPAGIWRTDGTIGGTVLLVNTAYASDGLFAAAGTSIFFDEADGAIWRYDTVAGSTVRLTPSGVAGSEVAEMDGEFYFAFDSQNGDGQELWKSDGSTVGTAELRNIAADLRSTGPDLIHAVRRARVVFRTLSHESGPGIWRQFVVSDGTAAGTVALRTSESIGEVAVVDDHTFFGSIFELWHSDLTQAGTAIVGEFAGCPGGDCLPIELTPLSGQLYGTGVVPGYAPPVPSSFLWRSDGTWMGTKVFFSKPGENLFLRGAASGLLYFGVGWPTTGSTCELWRSDGTASGTFAVSGGLPLKPYSLHGGAFLAVANAESGYEPSFTNGTPRHSILIKDIFPGVDSSMPSVTACKGGWLSRGFVDDVAACVPSPVVSNGTVAFFTANDGIHGTELWMTDGTTAGTNLVADIRPGAAGSIPSNLTMIGNEVYFAADDGVHGQELWKSDGTVAGTVMVADIIAGVEGSAPDEMIGVGSTVWFQATDPVHGRELWRSDGTATGTQLMGDINPGTLSSSPMYLAASGGSLFFSAFTETSGTELWVTDLPPQMDSITPSSGSAAGGETVTMKGWSFAPNATASIGGMTTTSSVGDDWTMTAQSPALTPGTLHDVVVRNASSGLEGVLHNGWFADFVDVPRTHPFHDFIEKLLRNGITAGCGGGNYCVSSTITRAEMAFFLLRSRYGGDYVPPAATGTIFADVAAEAFGAAFIEQLYREGVTGGCATDPLRYCPADTVNRATMAALLLRMREGSSFVPPPATGIFADVPPSNPFAPWIEELHARGITGGCGTDPLRYCPASSVTRGEMAVFATRTFALP